MKPKINKALFALLSLATVAFAAGCASEVTPYETNNADNYTVSIRYDANGGIFTTNTSSIVDSYNLEGLDEDGDGVAEIALLSPDNSYRGNDAFTAVNNGYFLAGWYANRTESKDSEGNTVYSYSDKWDFSQDLLKVETNGTYSSETPILTLYAAWVPLFEIEFYSLDSGELIESYSFDPTTVEKLSVPAWDEETGTIEMFNFPEKSGYTFSKAYYDANGENALEGETVEHPGVVDYKTGTAEDSVLKLYVDWTEGEWYRIYTAEQFVDNASLNGNYEIMSDLDFAEEIWPTVFMYGNFSGEIKGNGHVMKNIAFEQTNNSKVNAGLFGYLTENATISDITFENVSFTVKVGTRVTGTNYGLFAGTVSKDAAISGVSILNSSLKIDTACYFGSDDYSIGLVCGMGNAQAIQTAEIECVVVGDDPESMSVSVNGNSVTIDEAE